MAITYKNLPTDQPNEVWVGNLEVEIATPDGQPCSDLPFKLVVEGGATIEGRTDAEGMVRVRGLKPGAVATLTLPNTPLAVLEAND